MYGDASEAILKGCTKCGAKLFFYIKEGAVEKAQKRAFNLSSSEKAQIEKDVYDIIGSDIDEDIPVVLDLESINILKPGKYELDLVNLFKKKHPLIYKLEDGKYVIDVLESFKKFNDE